MEILYMCLISFGIFCFHFISCIEPNFRNILIHIFSLVFLNSFFYHDHADVPVFGGLYSLDCFDWCNCSVYRNNNTTMVIIPCKSQDVSDKKQLKFSGFTMKRMLKICIPKINRNCSLDWRLFQQSSPLL